MNPKNPGLSRQQRMAVLLLALVILASLIFWRLLPSLKPADQLAQQQELVQAWSSFETTRLDSFAQNKNYASRDYSSKQNDRQEAAPVEINMAPFDPNTADEQQLLALGLPLKTVRTLLKYRSKGGRFYSPEDLSKLYTLSKEDYNRILPYARVATTQKPAQLNGNFENNRESFHTVQKEEPQAPRLIDLNKADAEALMSLRGIGPGYSRRILKFRNSIGGFFKVDQLQEVYGFPDSTYQQLKHHFTVNPADVQKIALNRATEMDLAKHPYIGKRLAANIIKLRNDLKTFTDIEQLRQTPLINEEKYRKIVPYLSL